MPLSVLGLLVVKVMESTITDPKGFQFFFYFSSCALSNSSLTASLGDVSHRHALPLIQRAKSTKRSHRQVPTSAICAGHTAKTRATNTHGSLLSGL